jgi:hypothetical protein
MNVRNIEPKIPNMGGTPVNSLLSHVPMVDIDKNLYLVLWANQDKHGYTFMFSIN